MFYDYNTYIRFAYRIMHTHQLWIPTSDTGHLNLKIVFFCLVLFKYHSTLITFFSLSLSRFIKQDTLRGKLFFGERKGLTKYMDPECPCCPNMTKRYTVAILVSVGFVISFGSRCNIGVAQVKMFSNETGTVSSIFKLSLIKILYSPRVILLKNVLKIYQKNKNNKNVWEAL